MITGWIYCAQENCVKVLIYDTSLSDYMLKHIKAMNNHNKVNCGYDNLISSIIF